MRTIVELPSEQITPPRAPSERTGLSRAPPVRGAVAEYLHKRQVPPGEEACGLRAGRREDGLALQRRLRSEWDR